MPSLLNNVPNVKTQFGQHVSGSTFESCTIISLKEQFGLWNQLIRARNKTLNVFGLFIHSKDLLLLLKKIQLSPLVDTNYGQLSTYQETLTAFVPIYFHLNKLLKDFFTYKFNCTPLRIDGCYFVGSEFKEKQILQFFSWLISDLQISEELYFLIKLLL